MILWSVHVLFLEAVLEIGRIDLEPILRVAPVCQYIGHHQRQKGYLSRKCLISAISPSFVVVIGKKNMRTWYSVLLKQRKLEWTFQESPGIYSAGNNLCLSLKPRSTINRVSVVQSNILKLNLKPDITPYLVCKNEKK